MVWRVSADRGVDLSGITESSDAMNGDEMLYFQQSSSLDCVGARPGVAN